MALEFAGVRRQLYSENNGFLSTVVPPSIGKEIATMNKDVFKGKWNQLQGEIKKRWGKITDDDLKSIEGDIQKLIGKLQERYGMTKEEAEEAIEDLDI